MVTLEELYEERHYIMLDFKLLTEAEEQVKTMGYTSIEKWRNYDSHDLSEVYKGLCEDLGCVGDSIESLGGEL